MSKTNGSNGISRRKFLALTGGTAALASIGMAVPWAENIVQVDVGKMTNEDNESDVLVIGSGMAGLFAAVKAHDAGANVMMVSKGRLGSSGLTPFAKGIFAFDPNASEVSLDEFVEQVSRSALGTNNPIFTRQMAEHSLERVNELREWGFFESPLYNKSFNKPIAERQIPLVERVVITHLLEDDGVIAGAAGFSLDDEKIITFRAKSVVLCTGAGGFKPNGFPVCDLTHDGTIMAYDIGAKVTGKEWNDGHPGKAENPAACFDGWGDMFEQKPSTTGVGIRHDLGVDLNYAAYVGGNPIAMGSAGASAQGGPYVPEEFKRNGPPGPPDGGSGHGESPGRRPPPGRAEEKAARRQEWQVRSSAALQPAWPSTNPKAWCRSTIGANRISRDFSPPAMHSAPTWRGRYTRRWARHWQDRRCRVLSREKQQRSIRLSSICQSFPATGSSRSKTRFWRR